MSTKCRNGRIRPSPSPGLKWISALMLVCALAGCGGHAKNVLIPVADSAPNATKVDMLVATTRSRSTIQGEMFTGERALAPAFADITVSIPPANVRKIGEVAWPRRLPSNPATDFATLKADEITRDDAKKWLSASVRKSHDRSVLVFIHGFNNRFEDSVYRFAQIVKDSGVHSAPVLVTWPSRGSLLAYGYDRESTNYTRNALETLFQYLAKDPEVKEVSILAHSMGNWLALEALRQMAIRNGRLPAKFENVMLASPDVDVDVFRQQIVDMGKQHPKFTLFVSRDDRALAVSRRVWGDVARLGAIDPEQAPFKKELADSQITVIDLTKVKAGDSLNHGKFADSPEVVQLIGARISNGQTLTDSKVGLGDKILAATTSTAAAAGSAAGLILAAPVAVVDADTRDNYAGQVSGLTGPVGTPPKASECTAAGRSKESCRQ
ncbi:alpha/beta hydrolase [Rhizobium beringeri]|uniref:Alpha/beta fold hydrolase n=1 Tax=Rhizobium beringeri TaxID=3019934 RepID=A0ABY1XUU5_9HYPH|nr:MULTISPECIES: alpha/beta hydrolase [Rhizobium]NKL67283.1 alpha/beta fold hydrolase [Rhizobium leguminosarum bv. viciae]MBY5457646.1 alpha/beta hydrolase [Rhizobium leguminosarum]RWX15139.1 alpha/beta fold hydrolase [Rhizobium leguminosarum]TBC73538.1 alpha/beta fold hydrolase [Rhizobium leguminosarum]TBC94712.1 alpha/beta fold hydrolase [Rhizobium leguminosarum]